MQINLYNQANYNNDKIKKVDQFETLYKQIGCGKTKGFNFGLIKDRESELNDIQRKSEGVLTVEKTLNLVSISGNKYFKKDVSGHEIRTIPDFLDWLKKLENWDGIYWSKTALMKISNKYFANWHSIKDALKDNKACVSYNRNREEEIKLNDAIELSGLFEVLDNEDSTLVFKNSIYEEYKEIINDKLTSHQNLINILCYDVEEEINLFFENEKKILNIKDYKDKSINDGNETAIDTIKDWLDYMLDIIH